MIREKSSFTAKSKFGDYNNVFIVRANIITIGMSADLWRNSTICQQVYTLVYIDGIELCVHV